MKYLHHLRENTPASIVSIRGEGQSATRLAALGFLPGRTIHRRQTAPLGDPIAFELDGQKICLRREEAALIEIEA